MCCWSNDEKILLSIARLWIYSDYICSPQHLTLLLHDPLYHTSDQFDALQPDISRLQMVQNYSPSPRISSAKPTKVWLIKAKKKYFRYALLFIFLLCYSISQLIETCKYSHSYPFYSPYNRILFEENNHQRYYFSTNFIKHLNKNIMS